MHLNLRTKLLLATTPVLILVMGVATFVSYTVASHALRQVTEEALTQITDAILTSIDAWVEERKLNVMTWAQQDIYQPVVQEGDVSVTARDAANQALAIVHQAYAQEYDNIRVANLRGDIVASSRPEHIGSV
jgi:hypothetical protein